MGKKPKKLISYTHIPYVLTIKQNPLHRREDSKKTKNVVNTFHFPFIQIFGRIKKSKSKNKTSAITDRFHTLMENDWRTGKATNIIKFNYSCFLTPTTRRQTRV